ncbi:MAG: hypothetical protein K2W85_16165 [Phycisphaerales bacterium]|nr:hypothetical protein [Phycisphaerales bacterium]
MDGSNSGPTEPMAARVASPRSGRVSFSASSRLLSGHAGMLRRPVRLLLVTGLGACVLTIASVGVGSQLPAVLSWERVDGRWYWVAPDDKSDHGPSGADGYRVSDRRQDPRGVAVFVAMEREYSRGVFNIAVYRGYRLWWVDRQGHMRNPGVLAAIRSELTRNPQTREWASAMTLRGRRFGGRDWVGTGLYGACVVVPSVLLGGMLARGGRRAYDALLRAHAERTNRCTRCRYSLRDLPVEEAELCPECGTARGCAVAENGVARMSAA